jgi:hypothetical protein
MAVNRVKGFSEVVLGTAVRSIVVLRIVSGGTRVTGVATSVFGLLPLSCREDNFHSTLLSLFSLSPLEHRLNGLMDFTDVGVLHLRHNLQTHHDHIYSQMQNPLRFHL